MRGEWNSWNELKVSTVPTRWASTEGGPNSLVRPPKGSKRLARRGICGWKIEKWRSACKREPWMDVMDPDCRTSERRLEKSIQED